MKLKRKTGLANGTLQHHLGELVTNIKLASRLIMIDTTPTIL